MALKDRFYLRRIGKAIGSDILQTILNRSQLRLRQIDLARTGGSKERNGQLILPVVGQIMDDINGLFKQTGHEQLLAHRMLDCDGPKKQKARRHRQAFGTWAGCETNQAVSR
jgi:hypothetical protein